MSAQNNTGKAQGAGKHKLYSLELGRFLAASVVVLTHWIPDVDSHARAGQEILWGYHAPGAIGVQYFFVLSGFVMASAHYRDFGKWTSPFKFWWRRACRIYPVYWLALCIPIYYLYGFLTPGFSFRLFSLAPWSHDDFIAPAWSLRYEIAFYIMFGLALLPYVGKPLLAAWVFVAFWHWAPDWALNLLHLPPPFFINRAMSGWGDRFSDFFDYYFFAGLVAGVSHVRFPPGPRLSTALAAFGGGVMLFELPGLAWGDSYGSPVFVMAFCFCIAALLLGLAGMERHGWLRLPRVAGVAGAISYPLYILHGPVLLVFHNVSGWLKLGIHGMYALFVVGMGALYGISLVVTYVFDQPVQRGLRWLSRRKWHSAPMKVVAAAEPV